MQRINCNVYTATIYQIAMAFLLLWITRIGFYYYNRTLIDPTSSSHLWRLMSNGCNFGDSYVFVDGPYGCGLKVCGLESVDVEETCGNGEGIGACCLEVDAFACDIK